MSRVVLAVGGVIVAATLAWSYWPTLQRMVTQWDQHADYSHGYLVAPLAVLFLYLRRDEFPKDSVGPSIWGVGCLAVALGLRMTAGIYYLGPLDGWTFPLTVAGAVWLLYGWPTVRWSLPSIAFLWFMVPLPYMAETWVSVPLQRIATKLSTTTLVILGHPAISEGNVIMLGDQRLLVEEACSGLRILVGIFALAFAFVLFSKWSWWQKAIAVVAAVPIAMSANVVRIVGTGLLHQWVSGDAAKRFSHDISGFVMIPLAALMFWALLVYLDRLFPLVEEVSPMQIGRQA